MNDGEATDGAYRWRATQIARQCKQKGETTGNAIRFNEKQKKPYLESLAFCPCISERSTASISRVIAAGKAYFPRCRFKLHRVVV